MTLQVTQGTFNSVRDIWKELLPTCAANTIFLTPLWQQTWWETLGSMEGASAGRELLLLVVQCAGQPIGLAPLQRMGSTIAFLGDTDVFDYHDFIFKHGEEKDFYSALCSHLSTLAWDHLYFPSVPQESPTLQFLPEEAKRLGWQCTIEQEDVAPGLSLPKTWDDYLANNLNKKDRHELRRKMRRLFSTGEPKFQTVSDPQPLADYLTRFLDLMRAGREDKRTFLTPEREIFFRAICGAAASAGMLRLHFLELQGKAVAAAISFDYNGCRLLYNSGFSPEHASLSVGLLMKAMSVQEAIEKGMSYYDFLRGNEPYKYDLGGKDRAVYRINIWR